MSFLIKQGELLERLSNILYNSFDGNYDILKAEYEVIKDLNTISTTLSYIENERELYFDAPAGVASKNLHICTELRSLMKEHTGVEWDSFTLTLDACGEAKTKFHYPEA